MQIHGFKKWVISLLVLALVLSLSWWIPFTTPAVHAQDGDDPDTPLVTLNEENIKKATVFIMQTKDTPTGPVISCVGTGTLVSADGLILTNAHHVDATDTCPADRIVIALTLRTDETPVPTYVAEVLEFSRGLDLAVLKIVSFLDGRLIETSALKLPFVELTDSNLTSVDDTVVVFGYPEIGSEPVEAIQATITGFTAEANYGERAWIRTSANIPGVMSGGGMYNRDGKLIGVPTIAPARVGGTVVDCREVYDTDGNGQLDENDTCIPIGGAITAVRPSRLARGLVRAAALSIELGPERSPLVQPPPTDDPVFSRLFLTTGVNEAGMPINVVTGVPTNTNTLYLFFDYANMEDGMIYELRVTIDGRPSLVDSLPPATWSGGRAGLWYIGGTRVPRPNGTYQYTLFVEGRQVATSNPVTVGGGPREEPQFTDLIFGIQDSLGQFTGASLVVPEGNIIRARFSFANMRPGLQWRQIWYIGDTPLQGGNLVNTWDLAESQGTTALPVIESPDGFPASRYRLELYIILEDGSEMMTLTSDFIVAGGAGGVNNAEAQIFSNFRFAQGQNANLPLGLSENFSTQSEAIYVFFNWSLLSTGTPWTWRWYVDDDLLIEQNTQWSTDAIGENYFLSLVGDPYLPDATYRFEIEMGGIPVTRNVDAETEVGIGQLPVDAFASAEGIQLTGQIIDAETGEGISGAMFIVLFSDFSVEDFVWDSEQILGQALADDKGFFQIAELLPRGTLDEPLLYSVLLRAEGYLPMSADGIIVTDETESPLNLLIEMNRD